MNNSFVNITIVQKEKKRGGGFLFLIVSYSQIISFVPVGRPLLRHSGSSLAMPSAPPSYAHFFLFVCCFFSPLCCFVSVYCGGGPLFFFPPDFGVHVLAVYFSVFFVEYIPVLCVLLVRFWRRGVQVRAEFLEYFLLPLNKNKPKIQSIWPGSNLTDCSSM